jgi:micrococcal nuclease
MNKQKVYLLTIFIVTLFFGLVLLFKGSEVLIAQIFCGSSAGQEGESWGISCPIQTNNDVAGVTSSPSGQPSSEVFPEATVSAGPAAIVTRVIDGDTIEVDISGQNQKVRYLGVDTPETVDPRKSVQCFGKKASDENKKLVAGKAVELEKDVSETDKYGRLLRFVYIKNSDGSRLFVNDYLVRFGFARVLTFPPDVKFQQQFLEAQRQAQQNNLGLWKECR